MVKFTHFRVRLQGYSCSVDYLLKCAGLKLITIWDLKGNHMIIIIKNHKGKSSVEFPESVNLEKSYFTKHSLQSEAILKSNWIQNTIPECAQKILGMSSILIGAKLNAPFSANF